MPAVPIDEYYEAEDNFSQNHDACHYREHITMSRAAQDDGGEGAGEAQVSEITYHQFTRALANWKNIHPEVTEESERVRLLCEFLFRSTYRRSSDAYITFINAAYQTDEEAMKRLNAVLSPHHYALVKMYRALRS